MDGFLPTQEELLQQQNAALQPVAQTQLQAPPAPASPDDYAFLPPEEQAPPEDIGDDGNDTAFLPPEPQVAPAPTPVTPPASPPNALSPPVTTPPAPGSPTVPGMPNQPVPGWQGNKPEHLLDGPPNMPGPTEWRVDPNQTVRGQMELAPGSQLYDRIRASIVGAHRAKGGKNSLRAWQAAEMVVVDTAFKIGAADAQVYARSAEFNAAMKNQFSAAQQNFQHQALLSDQNYKQAMAIQAAQLAAEVARANAASGAASAYASSQADLMDQEQEHWIERASISHRYNVDIIGLQNTNQRGVMRLGATLDGQLDDRRTDNLMRRDVGLTDQQLRINREAQGHDLTVQERQNTHLANMANFDYRTTWSLNEQRQGHTLEGMDRGTDNAIRERGVAFGHQMTLNYQTEVTSNLRQNNALITQILSTPGLTAAQQQAAIRTIGQISSTTDELIGSFYTRMGLQGPGAGSGTGPAAPAPGGLGTAGGQQPAGPPGLGNYSGYRSYGNPYVANAAPNPGSGGGTLGGSYSYPPPAPSPSDPGGG